ncbi:hypothetical protein D7Y05_06405 [bacterium 1XD42-54]|nr:hypothetical protein D7Y05_06405 [bacterium 1XD42-54]
MIKWSQKELNKYPDIILTDCDITGLEAEKDKVIIEFLNDSFFLKDCSSGEYFRTNKACVIIHGCNKDSIEIFSVKWKKRDSGKCYDITPQKFYNKLKSQKWKCVVLEEYYCTGAGMFVVWIKTKKESFRCYISLRFSNIEYLWDEINYAAPL